ncbi:MAG: ubiquitin-activating E1 family protein [Chloroflexota bacterium]
MSDPRVSLRWGVSGDAADQVLTTLDGIRPIVYLPNNLQPTAAGAAAALVSMLGRLFPHLALEGNAALGPNPWAAPDIRDAYSVLSTTRPVASRAPASDLVVGVGPGSESAALAIGGDDWTVRLGRGAIPVGGERWGLGLHMAAALLVAEIIKRVLGPLGLANNPLPDNLCWNLLDYRLGPAPNLEATEIAPLTLALFGAGSVGSSTAGVLTFLPGLGGVIEIVDGDVFDPKKNPYRYPASTGREAGPKAVWLQKMLQNTGWQARAFVGSVAEWVAQRPEPGFDGLAISSVDTLDGRLQVADVLARNTISFGISGLALHLQRETLGDGWACPYCDFVDAKPALGQVEVWAQQSGLSVERVARLVLENGTLGPQDVEAATRAGRLSPERAAELVGRRLPDLIGRVYAEATLNTGDTTTVTVTAPYVSWVTGVLAAAEVAKAACGYAPIDRRIDLDLSGLPGGFTLARRADGSGRCLCNSAHRRRWMRRLYAN